MYQDIVGASCYIFTAKRMYSFVAIYLLPIKNSVIAVKCLLHIKYALLIEVLHQIMTKKRSFITILYIMVIKKCKLMLKHIVMNTNSVS